jgi:hypothetical protein
MKRKSTVVPPTSAEDRVDLTTSVEDRRARITFSSATFSVTFDAREVLMMIAAHMRTGGHESLDGPAVDGVRSYLVLEADGRGRRRMCVFDATTGAFFEWAGVYWTYLRTISEAATAAISDARTSRGER